MPEEFDPIAYINTPRWQTSRLGLERIADLLERMGRPQDGLRFVHVAGTNGKGSVCAFVAQVLTCAGFRTGLFTSPYIESFEERIRVDGENIAHADLVRATLAVREHASAMEEQTGDHPTEFELMTAVALEHFRAAKCDIVVLEVGLGGRLDSTNVVESPEVCAITRIGLDHTAILGDTLAQIAGEKAGIVKHGSPVVSWPQEDEAMAVIRHACAAADAPLVVPDLDALAVEPLVPAGDASCDALVRFFTYQGRRFRTQLLGSYQPANAALAIEVVEQLRLRGWRISDDALARGIALTRWPGRFEAVAHRPLTIVDGGHNPQGARALASSLEDLLASVAEWRGDSGEHAGDRAFADVVFVMGVLADKDYRHMIAPVLPFARAFVCYAPENPRALAAEELSGAVREEAACAGYAPNAKTPGGDAASAAEKPRSGCALVVETASDPASAMKRARTMAGPEGTVVAFGSLYSIGTIKQAVRQA